MPPEQSIGIFDGGMIRQFGEPSPLYMAAVLWRTGGMYSLLADTLLVAHAAFIVFVVGGQAGIVAGGLRGWRWVRHLGFRAAHLAAIAVVTIQAWAGAWCPLTVWENRLRIAAGQPPYEGTFIAHWLGAVIYHDAPEWVFTAAYTLFGLLVAGSWLLFPPRSARSRTRGT